MIRSNRWRNQKEGKVYDDLQLTTTIPTKLKIIVLCIYVHLHDHIGNITANLELLLHSADSLNHAHR